MELDVKKLDGKAAGKATVDEAIFGLTDIRSDLLHRTVRWQLAKRQAGTHKTQTPMKSRSRPRSSSARRAPAALAMARATPRSLSVALSPTAQRSAATPTTCRRKSASLRLPMRFRPR